MMIAYTMSILFIYFCLSWGSEDIKRMECGGVDFISGRVISNNLDNSIQKLRKCSSFLFALSNTF